MPGQLMLSLQVADRDTGKGHQGKFATVVVAGLVAGMVVPAANFGASIYNSAKPDHPIDTNGLVGLPGLDLPTSTRAASEEPQFRILPELTDPYQINSAFDLPGGLTIPSADWSERYAFGCP